MAVLVCLVACATTADFYVRNPYDDNIKGHKIILGYTATAKKGMTLPNSACDGSEGDIVWLTRTEVEAAADKIAPGYQDFLLKWWL